MKSLLFLGFALGILTGMGFSGVLWSFVPTPSTGETLLYEACAERGGLPQFSAWGHTVGCVGFGAARR